MSQEDINRIEREHQKDLTEIKNETYKSIAAYFCWTVIIVALFDKLVKLLF